MTEIESAMTAYANARKALAATAEQRTQLVTRRARSEHDILELNAVIARQRAEVDAAREALAILLQTPEE
jgi:uncharacterized coiled-coil protein SlyX